MMTRQAAASSQVMAQAMSASTKVMAAGNKAVNIQQLQKTMMQFEQQSAAMDMQEDISMAETIVAFV
jgi:hypothetical protein